MTTHRNGFESALRGTECLNWARSVLWGASSGHRVGRAYPGIGRLARGAEPVLDAAVVGRIGAVVLLKIGDKVRSAEAWRSEGATIIGDPGRCPWAVMLKSGGAATGRC